MGASDYKKIEQRILKFELMTGDPNRCLFTDSIEAVKNITLKNKNVNKLRIYKTLNKCGSGAFMNAKVDEIEVIDVGPNKRGVKLKERLQRLERKHLRMHEELQEKIKLRAMKRAEESTGLTGVK